MVNRIGCVVLAAGEGRRFGRHAHKLAAHVGGKSLLARAVDAACASQALSCTLVVGARFESLLCEVDSRRCAIVVNRDWKEGIASSVRRGLAAHRKDDACMFLVADQPFVSAADLDGLIESFRRVPGSIVALRAGEVWGTPTLFPRRDFAQLSKLQGDDGAKSYAVGSQERVTFVDACRAEAFRDVDTQQDLEALDAVL
ncbi:MAG: nucleotidyltransferase family protein [Candidatus Eremiobacteraeota bacterium]|nr:nucleotidyltransferase family protein [Candidatus Eremiobacteraeota bacterium]MBC5828024.1 nucleotidyltransferase family protein [Candidatus Eremiobacteraeota bacterium]